MSSPTATREKTRRSSYAEMRRALLLVLLGVLTGCPWNGVSDIREHIYEAAHGKVVVPSGGAGSVAFVARWRSTRGRQTVEAVAHNNSEQMRVTIITEENGKRIGTGDEVGRGAGAYSTLNCSRSKCDMQVSGTLTYEDLRPQEAGSVAADRTQLWNLSFTVTPSDGRPELTDLALDLPDLDGGVP